MKKIQWYEGAIIEPWANMNLVGNEGGPRWCTIFQPNTKMAKLAIMLHLGFPSTWKEGFKDWMAPLNPV